MYERILVPTDGSDASNAGLREACMLAKDQGSQLLLIHVVDEILGISPQIFGTAYEQIIDGLRKAGGSILAGAEFLARKEGLAAETQLVEAMGRPAGELIINAAKEWRADLIACGTHGRRGLRRILMGSDAEYIVRHSPIPILLIRLEQRHK